MPNFEGNTILDHRVMTRAVRKFPFQNLMGLEDLANTRQVGHNVVEWDEIHQSRDLANFTHPDSEANIQDQRKVVSRTAKLAPIKEKLTFKQSTLAWFRRPGTENERYGREAVRDELRDLDQRINRLVEWMIWESLHGQVAVDQGDVQFTVDYGIPADHQSTPNNNWDTGSATIIDDLINWKQKIQQDSNQVPDRVIMSSDVMQEVIQDSGVQNLIGENRLTESVARTGQIERLAGLDLIVYDSGYVDTNGNFQYFVGNKDIVMMTPPETDVIQLIEGPATDPMSNFQPGKFSKSWTEDDPATVQALIEYHVLPVIKKPENLYVTTVLS